MNIRRCFIIGILLCGIGILNAQVVITSEAEQRAKAVSYTHLTLPTN